MSGLVDSLFGGGGSTTNVVTSTPAPTAEEQELIKLNTELARRQLAQLDTLAPFQKELLDITIADLRRQGAETAALNAAITPEQQAAFAKSEFDRASRLGPIQEELLQKQLDLIRSGGAATPEQEARIKAGTDAAISAGSSDIDASTQRGLGLIADELANARGLRLSDSPIKGEAALLAREGEIQKGSLVKNLRAAEASAKLNYPLAVQQLQSGINLSTQNVADAAKQFQAELRQRAFNNRLLLSGQTSSTGLGLASVGSGAGVGTLSALSGVRSANTTRTGTSFDPAAYLQGIGSLARGIGMAGRGW